MRATAVTGPKAKRHRRGRASPMPERRTVVTGSTRGGDQDRTRCHPPPQNQGLSGSQSGGNLRELTDGLQQALAADGARDQAHEAIRSLFNKVVLTPAQGVVSLCCCSRIKTKRSGVRVN